MSRYIRKVLYGLIIMALTLPMMSPALAASLKVKVNSSSARVYQSPSTSSSSMLMKKGLTLTMTAVKGDWAQVEYDGVTGYCNLAYLNLQTRLPGYLNKNTYIYQSASSSSTKVALSVNTKVYVIGKSGDYYRVQNSDGSVTGYIKTSCVSKNKVKTEITRIPGYLNRNTYIYQKASSSSSKAALPVNTKVYVIGKSGSYYKVQNASGSVTGYVYGSHISENKVVVESTSEKNKKKVVKMDWFKGGEDVLKKGEYGYIYDIKSGATIRIKRMGGSNHADVEPATKADTAKLYAACGGTFSWDSRPVILIADDKFVACAINTMPHGDQTITNNGFDGQFCLHMVNSTTHGSEEVNANHQEAIEQAYNWAH